MHLHRLLRFDLFCEEEENMYACDDEYSHAVGPIKLDTGSEDNTAVFFFVN